MSCDCNTLVIGEAGPQGPQGLLGIDGTNGTNGINAFTTLTASFVQPNQAPAAGNSVTISVQNSAWIAVGQTVYISQAGYYEVLAVNSLVSITVSLVNVGSVSPGSTVSTDRKITPSSTTVVSVASVNSIDINSAFTTVNPALRVSGSNTLPLLQVDAILNKVGVNVSPVGGGKTLTVGGSFEVTGDSFISSGVVSTSRLKVGSGSPAAELTKLLYFTPTATVTLAGTVGSAQRVSVTCTGAALGDVVSIGYALNPQSTFEQDVSVSAVVASANTVNVFFQNYSTNAYSSVSIGLNVIVSTYTLAV